MMRTTLLGAATVGIVVLTAFPTDAATRVDGNHWSTSGVTIAQQGCFNPETQPVEQPRLRFTQGRNVPLGSRAVGWVLAAPQYGIGPTAHVAQPSTAGDATVKAIFPTGYGQGRAVVDFHPTGDTGHWSGSAPLTTRQTKSWQQVTTSGLEYSWRHYTADGVQDDTGGTATLTSFVGAHGGDGDGAELGFIFGCDGSTFFVDALTVGPASSPRTYNFEGYATRTALATKGFRTITYGERVRLGSEVQRLEDDVVPSGRVVLSSRPEGQKTFRRVAVSSLDSGRATFGLQPAHSTTLRARYLGTEAVEASRSRTVRVLVSTLVRARLLDDRIVKGQEFAIVGRTLPKKAHTKIKLQRYDGTDWSTVRLGLTDQDGHYRIGTKIARLGKSYWRVIVVRSRGNEAGKSNWMKVTVVAPPPPPDGGGGGGGGETPPPTDPTPPPPPDGPQ
jgi:hypothetical protein